MINEMKPLSMAEASKFVDEDLKAFFKKFTKIKPADAEKMREELEKIESMKIRPEHIVKIIDIMPEDNIDLNKIFADVSLDDQEASKIIEIVKKYK